MCGLADTLIRDYLALPSPFLWSPQSSRSSNPPLSLSRTHARAHTHPHRQTQGARSLQALATQHASLALQRADVGAGADGPRVDGDLGKPAGQLCGLRPGCPATGEFTHLVTPVGSYQDVRNVGKKTNSN